jgi:CheY-like chemotaxis protein
MGSLSILVVEDVEAFAGVLLTGLSDAGHRVVHASDGSQAANLMSRERFDLVITDIIMPEADGFDVIDTTRKLQPHARVFAMSGGGKLYSAHACLEAAETSNVDAILLKPFTLEDLNERIERLFPTPR